MGTANQLKHTPGPWSDAGPVGYSIGVISEGGWIAVAYGPGTNPNAAENVRLITAAPEMYEALKAYEALENHRMNCEECEERQEMAAETCAECFPFADAARCKIRAVIAKVEGC